MTSIRDAKEAREIAYPKIRDAAITPEQLFKEGEALGYLAALEGPEVKDLVGTLAWAIEWCEHSFGQKIVPLEKFHSMLKDTLAQYRKEVGNDPQQK